MVVLSSDVVAVVGCADGGAFSLSPAAVFIRFGL